MRLRARITTVPPMPRPLPIPPEDLRSSRFPLRPRGVQRISSSRMFTREIGKARISPPRGCYRYDMKSPRSEILMNTAAGILLALLAPIVTAAQEVVPVNLYVADLTYERGSIKVGTPVKLTGDRGVNSQPSFTPDGKAILFVGRRDSANAQSDVYRIDLATRAETRITSTAEMENSPTVTPEGNLMVIRWVPATLFTEWGPWIYDMQGRPLRGVLPRPDTVGYYVRADSITFAMVRPRSPSAIALFDIRKGTMTERDFPVANIPPQVIPGQRAVSYTVTDSAGRNLIRRLNIASGDTSTIASTVIGRVAHAWTPRGEILMGRGNRIFARAPARDSSWREIAEFSDPEL